MVVNEKGFLLNGVLKKIGKHYLCSEGKKNAHFRWHHLFLENVSFLWLYQITKHYKNRGFSKHKGKPKMALLVAKVPLWEGASAIHKSCVLQTPIILRFQQNAALQKNKSVSWKTTEIYQKLVVCKRVFFFEGGGWFCFFSLRFCFVL